MKYAFLGGTGEVGGSCMLLSVAGRHVLFDCGIRVNRTGAEALPDLDFLKESVPMLDAIFVSHAHADHIGALPLVHALYPDTPITCPQNKDILEVTDHPEWVSLSQIEKIRSKSIVDVGIQITESGIKLDAETLQSERWKSFTQGEHTATIKGNRLIIRKA